MVAIQHLLSIEQFDKEMIMQLLLSAERFDNSLQKKKANTLLNGKILGNLFFETSTRTRFSFTSAMLRLGGRVFNFRPQETRAEWGEFFSDTARMMNGYADVIVLRHKEVQFLQQYVDVSEIPVINAGIGGEEYGAEHPTQVLADFYTIYKEFKSIENRKVLIVGNMNLRVSRTLIKAFGQFPSIELYLLAPGVCWMSPKEEAEYARKGIRYTRIASLEEVLKDVEVIYQNGFSWSREIPIPEEIRLTKKSLQHIRKDAIILHPLPREEELAREVDDMHQAKYFVQASNAVPMRMAILNQLLS